MLKLSFILLAIAVSIISAQTPTTYTYKTVGNLSILADVYLPNTTNQSKYPVVLALHGGGYVSGDKSIAFSAQELDEMLTRGWAVVSIDYRLVPGVFLGGIVEDVQDAYAWIRTELINDITNLDVNNFLIWGGSAGGGLAVISGYMLTPRPKVIIALYPGCTNFADSLNLDPTTAVSAALITEANSLRQPATEGSIAATDPRWTTFYTALLQGKFGWLLTTSDPNEAAEKIMNTLRDYSAVYNLDAHYPPTFLIHGLEDFIVPYSQSVDMANSLKEKRIPYELKLVPDAGHGFDFEATPEEWQEYILPAFDFAAQYLKTESENITNSMVKEFFYSITTILML